MVTCTDAGHGRGRAPRSPRVAAAVALTMLALTRCGGGEPAPPSGTVDDPGAFTLGSDLRPFPWTAVVDGIDPGLRADPGHGWSLDFDVELDLRRHDPRYGTFTELLVAVQGQLRHDADGFYRAGGNTSSVATVFTVTGMPVERFTGWPELAAIHGREGSPFEAVEVFALPRGDALCARHRVEGTLRVELPADTPAGWYEPRLVLLVRVDGVPEPVYIENFGDNSNTQDAQVLPLVQVGTPAEPRLPWTLLTDEKYRGQAGLLPREERGAVALIPRSGFPKTYVRPPGEFELWPNFPTLYPVHAVPPVDGGMEVFPEHANHHLDLGDGEVTCRVHRPDGSVDELGTRALFDPNEDGPTPERFEVALAETGEYVIELIGYAMDRFGRRFVGGGHYPITIAYPISFSTSCKPGTPFLVGDAYPPKVNVNPPFPAEVRVEVDYYPGSDPARKVTWVAEGRASRFGHFSPALDEPLRFSEPGEYVSRSTARYVDPQGNLWMNQQTSASVVAPREPTTLRLHGTRSFPYNLDPDDADGLGSAERFEDRPDAPRAFMRFKPAPLPDTFAPYHGGDTLFLPARGFSESIVEPHLSVGVLEPALAARLRRAHTLASVLPPPLLQLRPGDWRYLRDVVQVSADSAAWFPASGPIDDELPVAPVGTPGWHAYVFPERNEVDAHLYIGVVRPGFPAMTAVVQSEAMGLYWLASPNRFGHHFNTGLNGDLPNDVYRIQAGAVICDRVEGRCHYDAYASSIAVVASGGQATAVLPPGERPLVVASGREHYLFVAMDPYDALEVGEPMGFGGMIFPAVPGEARWTVTPPDGEPVTFTGTANRLGLVRAGSALLTDQPGVYRVQVEARYGELRGDVVGTYDGTFWHSVVPAGAPDVLHTDLPPFTRVDTLAPVELELRWDESLGDATLHHATLIPGVVLDEGTHARVRSPFRFHFDPAQIARQHPNVDVRNFALGGWELADTVVFQFHLEAEGPDGPVHDSLRLALRGDLLFNYEALVRPADGGRHGD